LGKRTKDADVRLASGNEVLVIVGFDVGESREGAEHGRVDACGVYMFGGGTSAEIEGRKSDMEGVEGRSRRPGRGNRVARKITIGFGVGIDDEATVEGGGDPRKGWDSE
jgi:hypothetical protein